MKRAAPLILLLGGAALADAPLTLREALMAWESKLVGDTALAPESLRPEVSWGPEGIGAIRRYLLNLPLTGEQQALLRDRSATHPRQLVYFREGLAERDGADPRNWTELQTYVDEHKGELFSLAGRASSSPTAPGQPTNAELAQARVSVVHTYLVHELGVPEDQVCVRALSTDDPLPVESRSPSLPPYVTLEGYLGSDHPPVMSDQAKELIQNQSVLVMGFSTRLVGSDTCPIVADVEEAEAPPFTQKARESTEARSTQDGIWLYRVVRDAAAGQSEEQGAFRAAVEACQRLYPRDGEWVRVQGAVAAPLPDVDAWRGALVGLPGTVLLDARVPDLVRLEDDSRAHLLVPVHAQDGRSDYPAALRRDGEFPEPTRAGRRYYYADAYHASLDYDPKRAPEHALLSLAHLALRSFDAPQLASLGAKGPVLAQRNTYPGVVREVWRWNRVCKIRTSRTLDTSEYDRVWVRPKDSQVLVLASHDGGVKESVGQADCKSLASITDVRVGRPVPHGGEEVQLVPLTLPQVEGEALTRDREVVELWCASNAAESTDPDDLISLHTADSCDQRMDGVQLLKAMREVSASGPQSSLMQCVLDFGELPRWEDFLSGPP